MIPFLKNPLTLQVKTILASATQKLIRKVHIKHSQLCCILLGKHTNELSLVFNEPTADFVQSSHLICFHVPDFTVPAPQM